MQGLLVVRPRRTTAPVALALLVSALTVWPLLLPATSAAGVGAAEQQDRRQSMLLVLDSSGSMREPAGAGRTRFEAATKALNEVIGGLPGDLDVGLRIYGARIPDGPGSCRDSELVVPVGPLDRKSLRSAVRRARPRGNTPIAYSLRRAAEDLPTEGQRTIVLVSDGEESCGGDPCAVARDLSAQGLDVRVDVIGFQVTGAARDQLTCIAQAGRGTYYDAPDASTLTEQLERLSARAARAYEPAGTPIEGTPTADGAPLLDPGQYLDTIGDGGETETYQANVAPGGTLHAAATVRPTTSGGAESEALEVSVSSSGGATCATGRGSSIGAFNRFTPVSASLILAAEDLGRCGRGPYTVQFTRTEGSGVKPLEVVVIEEPRVTNAGSLPQAPEAGSYDVRARPAGTTRTKAVGAPSFSSAPVLEPGVYTDSILVGETLFYAVDLDWGQQLACDIRFGGSPQVDQALGFSTPTAMARLYGPTRTEITDLSYTGVADSLYEGNRDVQVHTATPPVRFLNRGANIHAVGASLPGTYYCAAFLNDDPAFSAGEVPIELTVDVVGEPTGGPDYAAASAGPTETAPASPSPDGEASGRPGAGGDADGDDGLGLMPWGLGLLVLLLVAAGVGYVVCRRA